MAGAEGGAEARKKRRPYRCFLVRCRMEEACGPSGEPAWRFTVQQVGPNAARRYFTSLREVVKYVETELTSCTTCDKRRRTTER
jgi:hypothetical protein